jgi:hypothetical protein
MVYDNEEEARIECITNTYKEIKSDIYEYNPISYMCIVNPKLSTPEYPDKNTKKETRKIIKRNPAYSPENRGNIQKISTVKIISKPLKRTIIASKVNII